VKTWIARGYVVAVLVLAPAAAMAQHDAHQPDTCADSARQATALLDGASARIETARQTNQPSTLRSAIEDLQATLAIIRTHLAICAPPQATAPTTAATPAPVAPKMPMVMTATDPARLRCAQPIDPATAPRTTHKGKTYYFCSDADRREFLTDPDMSLSMRPPL
jgi:YHS domain-containing protein